MIDVSEAVQTFLALGPALMMPVILFILSLIFRQPLGKSARSAILVGVAFVGIFAVLKACLLVIGDAVTCMVSRWGLTLEGIDIGWPLTAAITWAVPVAAIMIPLAFIVNIILLVPGWTKTFDADVWNYWHWAFTAVMVYMLTGNLILTYAIAIIVEILILKLADWTAPLAQKFFSIPGCSLPHTETVNWAPINLALEKALFSRIKTLDKVKTDTTSIGEKLGFWGEPLMIGFYVGIILGIIAGLPVSGIFELGIYLAALLFLEGRLVGILIEGLMPIANGIRDYFSKTKRFKGREILIGIDAAPIALANPTVVAVGFISLPILMVMAFIPGNRILPLADLAILPIFFMWTAAASSGNMVKTFFNGLVVLALILYMQNAFAAPLTQAAGMIGYALPAGILLASSLDAGGHILPFILIMPVVAIMSGNPVEAVIPVIMGIIYFAAWYYARDQPKLIAEKLEVSDT